MKVGNYYLFYKNKKNYEGTIISCTSTNEITQMKWTNSQKHKTYKEKIMKKNLSIISKEFESVIENLTKKSPGPDGFIAAMKLIDAYSLEGKL